jgi:hypothetical protein
MVNESCVYRGAGRRFLELLTLFSAGVAGSSACSETQDVQVDPDNPRPTPGIEERCGEGGVGCGVGGCCPAGDSCSDSGRCIPASACTSNDECRGDSTCGGQTCVPYPDLPGTPAFDRSCRQEYALPSLAPVVQCRWPGAGAVVEPNKVQVISTPMVVDFDFDDDPTTRLPSIVFISYEGSFAQETGVLRIIDGKDCTLQATIIGDNPFAARVPPALGDVNADGRPDIVVADQVLEGAARRSGIAVYAVIGAADTGFKLLGRAGSASTAIITGLAVHDVDGDEYPEILTEKTILAYDPVLGLRNLSLLNADTGRRPELTGTEPPVVVDVDGDRRTEMVTAQGIFYWNVEQQDMVDKARAVGEPLWNANRDVNGAFIAMADLGDFPSALGADRPSAELVIVGVAGELWVKQVDGVNAVDLRAAPQVAGPPVIADFDADGRMEFAIPSTNTLTVFDLDCHPESFNQGGCGRGSGAQHPAAVLWQKRTQGVRSGAAVFDFDGDGQSEVVHADQCFMRVYDGGNGDVLFSVPRMSTTSWEYPVVADVDGDGSSEIVTASNANDTSLSCGAGVDPENPASPPFEAIAGVTVWEEADDRWAGSRPVWNQHSYFVTNVNDDGTIPEMGAVTSHWNVERGGPNTYRQNIQGATGSSLGLVDVTTAGVAAFKCLDGQNLAEVTVDLCNRGSAPLQPADASLELVEAARPTNVLCRKANTELVTQALAPGSCTEVICTIPVTAGAAPFNVVIVGDPADRVEECYEDNNSSIIARVSCVRVIN